MKVTVIGAGNMGSTFVKQLTRAGHQVTVTARNLDKARAVAAAHPGAVATNADNAAGGTTQSCWRPATATLLPRCARSAACKARS
ncbi:MAG: NAD(P)-dependent oxidoreductase [Sphingomonadaceae bacterium]|nr:NAD(P)-dependent oxidoreductase [Sphingomonadaceae bacterium]